MIGGDPASISDPRGSGSVLALAFAFYLTGAVLLVVAGPALATLHAFAAFIVLAIVAASNQLIPVLTGAPPVAARQPVAAALPLALGFALLVAGFLGAPTLAAAGIVLAAGSVAWAAWTLRRLARAPLERPFALAAGFATLGLVAAALLGGALAVSLARGSAALIGWAPVHAVLAAAAFAGTLVVAISYRFVPMFALAHGAKSPREQAPQWLLPLGAFVCAAIYGLDPAAALRALFTLTTLLAIWALSTHLRTLRTRMRRRLDVSITYALPAWCFAVIASAALAFRPDSVTVGLAAIACAVLGWLSLSIVGYSYKIVGFLAWQWARTRAPGAMLRALGAVVPQRVARVALVALVAGAAVTALDPFVHGAAPYGAVLYLAGALGAVAALVRLCTAFTSISSAHAHRHA